MAKSTKAAAAGQPFPLWKHTNGQFAKKIRSKVYYFGVVADPDAALANYMAVKDDLEAGRPPGKWQEQHVYTIREMLDSFLITKQSEVASGEIQLETFNDYHRATDIMAEVWGLDRAVQYLMPEDFTRLKVHAAEKMAVATLLNFITRVRTVFNFALENDKIPKRPRYGKFTVAKEVIRRVRAKKGDLSFSAKELNQLLAAAEQPMRTWILLGINAAYTQHDIAELREDHIRDDKLVYWRSKTGIPRECVMWPETQEALAESFPFRHEERVYNAVRHGFTKLQKQLGVKKPNRGFRALRYTCETVAQEEECNQIVIDRILGHADESMGARYNQRIAHKRLKRVSDAVRAWLFGGPEPEDVKSTQRKTFRVVG